MKGPDTFKQIKETIFTEESKYNMLSDYRMVIHGIEWIINTGYDYISIMWDDTRLPREYHYKEIDYEMPKMIGEYDPNKDFKDFTGMPMLSHAKGIDKVYENPSPH